MAKTTRAVLNRTFRHAVEQGWIDSNPVGDGGSIRAPKRRTVDTDGTGGPRLEHHRALTAEERAELAWAVAVTCHREGTTVLPRAWDHLGRG